MVFSCKEKPVSEKKTLAIEKSNILEGLTISVDTIMVDAGEELITYGIPYISTLSPEARYFYILDNKTFKIHQIDLDSLAFIDSFFIEKEGPNSPGFTFMFQPISEDQFFFPSFQRPSIINASGEKIRSWNLNLPDIIDGFSVDLNSLTNRIVFNSTMDQLYSLPVNYETREYYLAVLNSYGKRKRIIALPEFNKANAFTIRTGGGEGGGLKIEFPYLQHLNDEVIISCTVGNGIYRYDPSLDSISYREFPLKIVPLEKKGEIKNRVHRNEEFEVEVKKIAIQISHWNFIWDEASQLYFRFASRVLSHRTKYKESKMEIFLMAFSKELELVGETRLEGLTNVPHSGFFKEGKLWSNVNVADDLGFSVIDFQF